jgi:UDP-N-acetylmuramoyl-tripeptide--D-alanyl-D-alanine ligase
VEVTGWSVDSRTLAPGDLFFALRGPNHDGHLFVEQALGKGAVAAVVERAPGSAGSLLAVPDTYEALLAAAAWARRRWAGTVVAVSGSAGKTTTKEIIARLLATRLAAGKSGGNLNNHVGLPLSLLRLPADSRVAVLEIGMNHAGEIRRLAAVARPDVAVVTNAGYAHIEHFDSLDGVALAKRELVESLEPAGTAVLNADDPRVADFARVHPGPVITFGFSEGAGVRAVEFESLPGETRFRVPGAGSFVTRLEGRHSVLNILAGLAVAGIFGIPAASLRSSVAALEPEAMRGRRLERAGITILDDCYNSNPDAVRVMLESLRVVPARRRIAVLGEMLELGRWTEALHQEIGRAVAACRVDVLVGIRGAARHMANAAVDAGLPSSAAYFFPDPEPAGDFLRSIARPGDAILFKGSRGTRVERALERFLSPAPVVPDPAACGVSAEQAASPGPAPTGGSGIAGAAGRPDERRLEE